MRHEKGVEKGVEAEKEEGQKGTEAGTQLCVLASLRLSICGVGTGASMQRPEKDIRCCLLALSTVFIYISGKLAGSQDLPVPVP